MFQFNGKNSKRSKTIAAIIVIGIVVIMIASTIIGALSGF